MINPKMIESVVCLIRNIPMVISMVIPISSEAIIASVYSFVDASGNIPWETLLSYYGALEVVRRAVQYVRGTRQGSSETKRKRIENDDVNDALLKETNETEQVRKKVTILKREGKELKEQLARANLTIHEQKGELEAYNRHIATTDYNVAQMLNAEFHESSNVKLKMARLMKAETTFIAQEENLNTSIVEMGGIEQAKCVMKEEEKKDPCQAEHADDMERVELRKKTEPEEPTQAPTNCSDEIYPQADVLPLSGMITGGAPPSPLHRYQTPSTSAPSSGSESDYDAPSPFIENDVSSRSLLNTVHESEDDSDEEEASTMIWHGFKIDHIVHKLVPRGMRDNFYHAFPLWLFQISQTNEDDEKFVKHMTRFLTKLKQKADKGKTWNQDCFPEDYNRWTGQKGIRTLCTWQRNESKLWSKPHKVSVDTVTLRQKDKNFASGGKSICTVY